MKRLLLILLLLPVIGSAQERILPIDASTKEVVFTDIFEVDNVKDKLFSNAQSWAANSFGDYKSVLQFEDKVAGKLILKGQAPLSGFTLFDRMKFKVSIDVKDGKYRCVIDDIQGQMMGGTWFPITGNMSVAMLKENDSLTRTLNTIDNKRKKRKIEEQIVHNKDWVYQDMEVKKIIDGLLLSLQSEMAKKDDF